MTKRNKSDSQKRFMTDQIKEIEIFKWLESEKEGQDIGWEEACRRYIKRCAPGFRHKFICRDLENVIENLEQLKDKVQDKPELIEEIDKNIQILGDDENLVPPGDGT